MVFNRGDICIIRGALNFNPAKGGEIGKLRPAIVISQKEDNEILDTIIVIPLSTVIEESAQPYRVFISAREKLLKDSDACIYEVRALSKVRAKEKIANLLPNELETIEMCLCSILST